MFAFYTWIVIQIFGLSETDGYAQRATMYKIRNVQTHTHELDVCVCVCARSVG